MDKSNIVITALVGMGVVFFFAGLFFFGWLFNLSGLILASFGGIAYMVAKARGSM